MSYSRHKCREYALQLLYQMEVLKDASYEKEIDTFFLSQEASQEAQDFTRKLVLGTLDQQEAIDETLNKNLEKWRLDRLSLLVQSLLRLAIYEMNFSKDAPYEVIIDEAVTLAKDFVDETAKSFVNKVLQNIHDRQQEA